MYIVFVTGESMGKRFDSYDDLMAYVKSVLTNRTVVVRIQLYA